MPRKKTHFCETCQQEKPRQEMMISAKGRAIGWCRVCYAKGQKRCRTCDTVQGVDCFHAYAFGLYDDGKRQIGARCRKCAANYDQSREPNQGYIASRNAPTLHARVRRGLIYWRWRAKKKGIGFDLTAEYLEELFHKQDGRCFFTGEEMVFVSGEAVPHSASLDRLDNSLGYIAGNVAWVTNLANRTKNSRGYSEFLDFCQQVLNYRAGQPHS